MQLQQFRIGLRAKTLLGLILPLAALFLILTAANERYLTNKITGNYRTHLEAAVKSFIAGLEQYERNEILDESRMFVNGLRKANPLYEQILLFAPTGHDLVVLAKSQSREIPVASEKFYETALSGTAARSRESQSHFEIAVPVAFKDKTRGVLAVKVNLAERDKLLHNLRNRAITLIGLGLVLISAIMFFGIDHSFLGPLKKLREATVLVGKGEFTAPFSIGRQDELGDLTRSIADMTNRLRHETQSLEQRVSELSLLYNISKVTSSALNLDETLEIMLESAVKVTEATSGFIMLAEKDDRNEHAELQVKASLGVPAGAAGAALISNEIARFVFGSGGPLLLVGDITSLGFQQHREFKDAIYAPINFAEETIGVVGLTNKQAANFTKKDLQLLLTLANQASGVIKNARLFEDLQASYFSTIQALAAAIDAKDPYTRGHSSRVVGYSQFIASKMLCSEEEVKAIKIAAYLHDIGKIGIDEQILLKESKLSGSEYQVVKNHPTISAKILARVSFLQATIPMVRHHHEHFDGAGYPDELSGTLIPLGARIIAVADSFDAMTSNRPYRQALSRAKALEELTRAAGAQFDPIVVEAFVCHIGELLIVEDEETAPSFI